MSIQNEQELSLDEFDIDVLEEISDYVTNSLLLEDEYSGKAADIAFMDVKNFVFSYLNDSQSISTVSNNTLISYYEFLIDKHNEIQNIKQKLNIMNYSYPFTEIGRTMEEYKENNSIKEKTNDILYVKLAKDVSNANEQISLCYGIIRQIIIDRNIFRN